MYVILGLTLDVGVLIKPILVSQSIAVSGFDARICIDLSVGFSVYACSGCTTEA